MTAAAQSVAGVLILAAGAGLGGLVLPWLGPDRRPGPIESTVAGLAVGAFLLWSAGLCGLAVPAAGWILLAAGLAEVARRRWPRWAVPAGTGPIGWPAAAVFVLSGCALTLSLVPPTMYDTVSYHLVVPQQILLRHKVTSMEHFLPAAFPFVAQGGYLWAFLVGSGWRGAGLLNAGTAVLAALVIVRLGAALGLKGPSRWAAAAVWLAIPLVQTVAGTPLADLQVVVSALLAVVVVAEHPRARSSWWMAGIWAGLAGSCKYQAAVILLPLAAGAWMAGRSPRARARLLTALGAGALAPLAVIGAKNWIFLGDPVFPFLTPGETREKLLAGLSGHYEIARSVSGALALPARLAWPGGRPPFSREIWETGPVLLALYGLPWLAWRERAARPVLAAVAAGTLGMYALGFALAWQMRHFLPLTAVCAVAWLAAAERWRRGRELVFAALCVLAVPAWPGVVAPFRSWLAAGGRTDAYLGAFGGPSALWPYRASVWVRDHTPAAARILCVFEPQAFYAGRRLETSLMNDRSLLEDELAASPDAAGLSRRLRRHGITWLLVCNGLAPDHAALYLRDISNRERAVLRDLIGRVAVTRFGRGDGLYLVLELVPSGTRTRAPVIF